MPLMCCQAVSSHSGHIPRHAAPCLAPAGLAILGISEKGGKASLPWYTFFIGSWSRDSAEEAAEFYKCAVLHCGADLCMHLHVNSSLGFGLVQG